MLVVRGFKHFIVEMFDSWEGQEESGDGAGRQQPLQHSRAAAPGASKVSDERCRGRGKTKQHGQLWCSGADVGLRMRRGLHRAAASAERHTAHRSCCVNMLSEGGAICHQRSTVIAA